MLYINNIIVDYKNMITLESNENIISEMMIDLKYDLLKSVDSLKNNLNKLDHDCIYNLNYSIYSNIKNNNKDELLESLDVLFNDIKNIIVNIDTINIDKIYENYINDSKELNEYIILEGLGKTLSNIKNSFSNKHNKLVERDKKWIKSNKKTILSSNFDEIELEVLSDNKVTFEGLLNRHNIFDKIFVNSENVGDLSSKLARFEDKHGDLKNGLDNYFRTGTSRREIGLRKVSGPEAKVAVENMIAYCESFLAGKSYLEEKINNIIIAVNDSDEVEESFKFKYDNPYRSYTLQEALDENDDLDLSIDDIENNDTKDNNEEVEDKPENKKPTRGIRDRQIGVTVLMTVAEERYFDYINILKELVE
jgi:hypothetical protein